MQPRKSTLPRGYFRCRCQMGSRWGWDYIRDLLVMDKLTEEVSQESPWTMMFADIVM